MNTSSSSPFSLPDGAPELARRFCMILAGLAGLVARRFVRMPHLAGFTVLLWGRLNRAVRRFARAMVRPAAVRAPRGRLAREGTRPASDRGLPSGRAWLVRELGYEAAGYGAQLQHLLDAPELQDLLAERPAIGRILRPLCRMLGVAAPLAVATTVAISAAPRLDAAGSGASPRVWQRREPTPAPGDAGDFARPAKDG